MIRKYISMHITSDKLKGLWHENIAFLGKFLWCSRHLMPFPVHKILLWIYDSRLPREFSSGTNQKNFYDLHPNQKFPGICGKW